MSLNPGAWLAQGMGAGVLLTPSLPPLPQGGVWPAHPHLQGQPGVRAGGCWGHAPSGPLTQPLGCRCAQESVDCGGEVLSHNALG